MVVADEPQAAVIGRQALEAGGTAADAAAAMALAMAVTLPSRVGLGGGGACLLHDPAGAEGETVRVLDFLPRAAGAAGEPALLRGLAALQARHGRRRWAEVVRPAETLARFGAPVSRVFARDLAAVAPELSDRPALAGFIAPAGRVPEEGTRLAQRLLADSLAALRQQGIGAFYRGAVGERYRDGAAAAGVPLDLDRLDAVGAAWGAPLRLEHRRDVLAFAPQPALAGPTQGAAFEALREADYEDLEPPARAAALVDALAAAGAEALGGTAPGAVLAVADADELGVACGFTMNRLFGTGALAGDSGLLVAAPPAPDGAMLGGLALLVNEPTRRVIAAAAGADRPVALALPLAEAVLAGQPVGAAVRTPRAAPDGSTPRILVEAAADPAVRQALARGGRAVRSVEALGRAALLVCERNSDGNKSCRGAADPRSPGLAALPEPAPDA